MSEPSSPIEPAAADTPTEGPSTLWLTARILAVALVSALLGLLILSVVRSGNGARFVSKIEANKKPPAPAFDLAVLWSRDETWPPRLRPALADGRLTLAELRGQPVVINFWASWCLPCKLEAPAFDAVAARYRGRVAFLGLDVQDGRRAARGFLRRYDVNYVSVHDGGDKTYNAYGLTGVPETYFVDRRGRAVGHAIGRLRQGELARRVAALLAG